MSREFEGFGIDEVDICRRNGKDNAIGLSDVFCDKVSRLFFDICRLVTDWNLRFLALVVEHAISPLRTLVKPGRSTKVKLRT